MKRSTSDSVQVSCKALCLCLVLAAGLSAETPDGAPPPGTSAMAFHRGLCVEGGRELQTCHIADFTDVGATHVSLNPFGWMDAPDRPEVRTRTGGSNPQHRWYGESDAGLRQYADLAHEAGLDVMLRPHIWLRSGTNRTGRSGLWLQDVAFPTEEEWQTFFDSYRTMTLHYARIAEEAGMEWYSVGAELTTVSTQHPEYWRELIADVREVYSGKVIYSANWWAEVEGITFWEDLDAIGVQAYFPIADGYSPTREQLVAGWEPHLEMLGDLSAEYDRPVIFTEIGYKATEDGAQEPWEWQGKGRPDEALQARAYAATLEALENAPFVQGVYWWKYHPDPCATATETALREREGDFSWQGNPAEDVLQQVWAGK